MKFLILTLTSLIISASAFATPKSPYEIPTGSILTFTKDVTIPANEIVVHGGLCSLMVADVATVTRKIQIGDEFTVVAVGPSIYSLKIDFARATGGDPVFQIFCPTSKTDDYSVFIHEVNQFEGTLDIAPPVHF